MIAAKCSIDPRYAMLASVFEELVVVSAARAIEVGQLAGRKIRRGRSWFESALQGTVLVRW